MKRRHVRDVARLEGIDEEAVRLLTVVGTAGNVMNPWRRNLPGIFRGLGLHSGQELLDIPCGEGGVSVPLARRYRIQVRGYDIRPECVRRARSLAGRQGVADLCRFAVGDVREVVERRGKVDVLLWIAPPHVWGRSRPTIRALRHRVKVGGLIVIGDAHLLPNARSGARGYDDYETLDETTEGYVSCGDRLRRLYDYRDTLWERDYALERRLIQSAIRRSTNAGDRRLLVRHLKRNDENEKADRENLGTAIWVIERT